MAHSEELPVPKSPKNVILSNDEEDKDFTEDGNDDVRINSNFEALCSSPEPHLLIHEKLSDPV